MKIFFRSRLFFGLAFLCFVSCHKPYYLSHRADKFYIISNHDPVDSSLVKMIMPYKMGVDTQMDIIIGHTDIPLTKAQPECTLGNFMADAQLETAKKLDSKVVGSVMNYGGIRLPYIAPGAITKGKIYELMPFDNMLTIIEIPGETLKQFCNHMAKYKGWPVSGITYTIKDKKAVDVKIDGRPVNDAIVYKIAISDYIARGGDNCDFLSHLKKRYTTIFVRDALIDYVMKLEKEHKPLHPELEKRIQYAE